MKILFFTVARSEWGYIRPILELFKNNNHFHLDIKVFCDKVVRSLRTTCADQVIEFSIYVEP